MTTQSAIAPSRLSPMPRVVERGVRAREALGGERARALEPEQRRIGRLRRRGVLAGGLAERSAASAFDVEDVVDDLKREADLGGVAIDRRDHVVGSAPAMIAPLTAEARISAPVLRACIARRPSASSVIAWPGACPAACRSIACPPTMPAGAGRVADDLRARAACAPTIAGSSAMPARARAARTPRRAGRRRRGWRCRRRRRRAASAGRAAACRCPSPADRRGSASRCESARSRRRPAARRSLSRLSGRRASPWREPRHAAAASVSIGRSRLPPAKTL